jgi:1-acyl-sn-glycerol-3-phosphate acyltransferase
MSRFRSALFNTVFYVNLALFLVGGFMFFFTPRRWSIKALQLWAETSLWWLERIVGTRMEVRGLEHLPAGACIVAGKHQSAFDTFALLPLLVDPAVVMKRELMFIPFFGWFSVKFKMIGIDRSAGASAIKRLVGEARAAVAIGRQVLIFPEGSRRPPDAPPDYKPGASAVYLGTGVACVPFGLNSGLFWPRRQFMRRPGTIIVEFRPAIPAGLARRAFEQRLEAEIEDTTRRLVAEGRRQLAAAVNGHRAGGGQ